jgi:hypothetical protein
MADRIMILSAGRVVLEGTPQSLTAAVPGAGVPRVVTFGAPAALDVVALAAAVGPGTTAVETAAGRYRVEASEVEIPAVAAAVTNFLAVRDATLTDLATGKSLEDVYFETVGAAAEAAPEETSAPATGRGRGRRRAS